MIVAFPIHILAAIVLLGGLFFASVAVRPSMRGLGTDAALMLWHRMLSRFFAWAGISVLLILATGIGMVFLKFGGFSGVPAIHRGNMAIGIPAIALSVYVYFGPWRRYCETVARRDWAAAQKNIARLRVVMVIILVLGLVASAVSAVGRYV
jgi:uncharacterized membrane protein